MEGLYALPRTGWVKRGVENPESVGAHIDSLVTLVDVVSPHIPGLDTLKLQNMLKVHDWPEYEVGDIVTALLSGDELVKVRASKYEQELAAMKKICAGLGAVGEECLGLWLEFEHGDSLEANIGRQMDKLQAVLKAAEYARAGQPVQKQEFVDHAKKYITHPVLVKMMEEA